MSRQGRNSVRSDTMVEEEWVDTLKKEVIEYTVDRNRHKELTKKLKEKIKKTNKLICILFI